MVDALTLLRIYGDGAMGKMHGQAGEEHSAEPVAQRDRNLVPKPPVRHTDLISQNHTD